MVTLDSFLIEKYLAGMIAREEVVTKAQDPVTIQAKLQELELAAAVGAETEAAVAGQRLIASFMAEDISNPLLSLVKEQGLIDDLQYEEVLAEFKRTGKPVIQILQDFGIMDLDTILQVMANHLGTEVVTLRERDLTPELLQTIPAKTARMYQCLPVAEFDSTLQVALADPLNPGRIDELGFVVKKDIQLVVADPAQIQKAIEKYYGRGRARAFPTSSRNWARTRRSPRKSARRRVTDDAAMMARPGRTRRRSSGS